MSTTPQSFRIDGELTIYRAAELALALKAALASVPEGGVLELELREVSEIDSAGVQLLLATRRSACDGGRTLKVAGRSAPVDDVLGLLRLGAHFGDAVAAAQ